MSMCVGAVIGPLQVILFFVRVRDGPLFLELDFGFL